MNNVIFAPDAALARFSGPNETAARAALRRSAGRPFEEAPDLWPLIIPFASSAQGQRALALGTSLWAIHQQSDAGSVHVPDGPRFGQAMRKLRSTGSGAAGVDRRFDSVIGSEVIDQVAVHLRGLVQLARGHGIVLDYGRLCRDLNWYQRDPRETALRWSRDYFIRQSDDSPDSSGSPIDNANTPTALTPTN